MRHGAEILTSVCDAASMLARRLGLGRAVQDCLVQQFERWDGKGPYGMAKDEVALPARVGEVATQAVLFLDAEGPEAAIAMAAQRAGGVVRPWRSRSTFCNAGATLIDALAGADPWQAVLEAEPPPVARIDEPELDRASPRFADMVDLKSPYTVGHSSQVAELAEAAARTLGFGEGDIVTLRRAALLHDLGRVGVSSGVWDKKGPLTRSEWERIRLHPYHTERILSCSATLAPLVPVASLHHERLDGSGYHHGLSAPAIPMSARVPAVADAFQTATQDRPHRAARTAEQAAELILHRGRKRRAPRRRLRGGRHRSGRTGASPGTPRVARRPQRPGGRGAAIVGPRSCRTSRSRHSWSPPGAPPSTTCSTSTARSATPPAPPRPCSPWSTTCSTRDTALRRERRPRKRPGHRLVWVADSMKATTSATYFLGWVTCGTWPAPTYVVCSTWGSSRAIRSSIHRKNGGLWSPEVSSAGPS